MRMTAMKFAKFHRCCVFDLACDDCLVVLEMVLWQGDMKGGGVTCPICGSPEADTDNHSIVWRRVRRMKAATLAELTVKIDTNVATPTAPHPFRMPTTPGGQSPWAPMTPPCPTPATPPNPTPPNTPQSPQSVLDEISGQARCQVEKDTKNQAIRVV